MDITLLITIIGIFISIMIPVAGYYYKRKKEYKTFYSLLWKGSKSLKPKDLLGERPFTDKYLQRDVDNFLKEKISKGLNALVVGTPLSGKTRAIYNALRQSAVNIDVLATRNISSPSLEIPFNLKFWNKKLIVIDDFQNFIEKQDNFHLIFKEAKEKSIPVIATNHSGREYRKAKNKLVEQNLDLEMLFDNNIFEIKKMSVEEAKSFAGSINVPWDNVKFNGTIGSVFMKLSEMERRYDQCDAVEKTILRSLRCLYKTGVYEETCVFRLNWIKKISAASELEGKDYEWSGWMKSLEDKEFVLPAGRNKIWAEDAYLEYVVKHEPEIPDIELFEDIFQIFKDDPEVLQMSGERAYDLGSTSLNISNYVKLSASAFERILQLVNPRDNVQAFIKANNYLGICYWSLSKLENTKENCLKSISHFKAVLENPEIKLRPFEYAMMMNRLGNSYSILSGMENKETNCRMAISMFEESLKFYTINEYPGEYAQINNNLGGGFLILSDVENSSENLNKAAQCFEKSLKVRTKEEDPVGYAFTRNNLANTFARLSQIEAPEKNLALALQSYEDILEIYRSEKFPMQFGMTMNNIGNVYCLLSGIKDKKENALKAKDAYEKALESRTQDNAPVQYSKTIFNLADVYLILYEAEGGIEHVKEAIGCLEQAGSVEMSNIDQYRQGEILHLLGRCYGILSTFEYRMINQSKSVEFYQRALQIFTEKDFPEENMKIKNEMSLIGG